jgi:hypothetical protein
MDKVEKGEVDDRPEDLLDSEDEDEAEDYMIPDEKPRDRKHKETKRDRESYVPMNIHDLYE